MVSLDVVGNELLGVLKKGSENDYCGSDGQKR